MALAVVKAARHYLLIPATVRVWQHLQFGYPLFLLLLLTILIVGDPGRIVRDKRWLRLTSGLMVAIMTLVTAVAAIRLVVGLLTGAACAGPAQLLAVVGIIWATNVIAFALWYWLLDAGGPASRTNNASTVRPAFRFPEQDIADLLERGWYPQFVDYLALSFNTATAFSPTHVSAIRHWSKLALIVEAAVSLTIAILVVARGQYPVRRGGRLLLLCTPTQRTRDLRCPPKPAAVSGDVLLSAGTKPARAPHWALTTAPSRTT